MPHEHGRTSQQRHLNRGLAALANMDASQDFSVIEAIGGIRGIVESMLPGVVFVVLFVVWRDLRVTLVVSSVLALLQVVVRLVQRQSTWGAISGLISVAICLIWAWQSHEARNYYMFGFISNAVYALMLVISLVVRVPGLGLMIEFIRTLPMGQYRRWMHGWLDDAALRRAYMWITALWVVVFSLRLGVQVPLYLADRVALLGTARLIMGIPFWALAIWVSYLIVATPLHDHVHRQQADQPADAEQKPPSDSDDFELADEKGIHMYEGRVEGHE